MEADPHLKLIFDPPMDDSNPDLVDGDRSVDNHLTVPEDIHPMQRFVEGLQSDAALGKGTGVADAAWDSELTASPRTFSKAFEQRSDARLEKVFAKVRTMFAGHPEEMQEAIEIVRGIREHLRAEVGA